MSRPSSRRTPSSPSRFLAVLILTLVFALQACSDSDPAEPEPDPEPLAPVDLVDGTTLGTVVFPTGNTGLGGQGQPIGGIDCIGVVNVHYHAHLSLFVEGERIAIPPAVGITSPRFNGSNTFVTNGDCLYWLHTHDATGLIHIEPPDRNDYTVGNFFDVWGVPLSNGRVGDFEGTLSAFVNGERYEGDPRDIVLTSRKHVSLQVGRPLAPPPLYIFQG